MYKFINILGVLLLIGAWFAPILADPTSDVRNSPGAWVFVSIVLSVCALGLWIAGLLTVKKIKEMMGDGWVYEHDAPTVKPESQQDTIDRLLWEMNSRVVERSPGEGPFSTQGYVMEDLDKVSAELDALEIYATPRTLHARARALGIENNRSYVEKRGSLNQAIACVFCGSTNCVRVIADTQTEQYRSSSIVGKALDVGFDVEKAKLKHYCEQCLKTWHTN